MRICDDNFTGELIRLACMLHLRIDQQPAPACRRVASFAIHFEPAKRTHSQNVWQARLEALAGADQNGDNQVLKGDVYLDPITPEDEAICQLRLIEDVAYPKDYAHCDSQIAAAIRMSTDRRWYFCVQGIDPLAVISMCTSHYVGPKDLCRVAEARSGKWPIVMMDGKPVETTANNIVRCVPVD